MGIFDKIKDAVTGSSGNSVTDMVKEKAGPETMNKVEEAVKSGIDKTAEAADKATGGKYNEQVDTAADKAKDVADKIDGQEG